MRNHRPLESFITPLQQWMSDKGLTDGAVAKRLGVSRVHVNRIRRGLLGASIPTAKRLEQLTGLPFFQFLRPDDGRGSDRSAGRPSVRPWKPVRHSTRDGGPATSNTVRSKNSELAMPSNSGANLSSPRHHAPTLPLDQDTLTTVTTALRELLEWLERSADVIPAVRLPAPQAQWSGDLLTMTEVREFFGGQHGPLDPSTIYNWIRQGRFPKPVKIGGKLSRWRKSDCLRVLREMSARAD